MYKYQNMRNVSYKQIDIESSVLFIFTIYTLFFKSYILCAIVNIFRTCEISSNCESVVLPKLGDQIKGKEEIFCPRCDCKYENRNTTIIKVFSQKKKIYIVLCNLYNLLTQRKMLMLQIVVIIVIWVISLLVIYMLFLICLDPLLNKRIHKASANIGYHEHNNEEV